VRELWNVRAFRWLFLAGLLSELGTFVSEVAIFMRIFELAAEQKHYLGITQGLFLLFMIAGTVLGGVFGEGAVKRRVLITCEVARVPALLAMLAGTSSLWTLILGNGVVAFFSGAFNPTRQALTNEILPAHLLPRANGIFSVAFALLHAVGPLVGGVLYGIVHDLSPILLFDLGTYFVGIGLLLKVRTVRAPAASSAARVHPSFWDELRGGLQLVARYPEFRAVVLRCFIASSVLGIAIPLLLPLVTEILRLPEWGYGVLLGVFGAGGIAGGLLAPFALRTVSVARLLKLLFFAECLSFLAWTLLRVPFGSFALAFVYGAILFARIASQLTFVSFEIPRQFNARANSLVDLSMVVPNVAGAACVALLGSRVDTPALLVGTAAAFACVAFALSALELRKPRS
jgi:MFS family permease